jgi:hypothetical protein
MSDLAVRFQELAHATDARFKQRVRHPAFSVVMARQGKQVLQKGISKRTRRSGERNKSILERKEDLERDPYVAAFTSKSVVCGGCHKTIKTDGRNSFYPGLWRKHRDKCKKVAVRGTPFNQSIWILM